jgi:hypothetical protein
MSKEARIEGMASSIIGGGEKAANALYNERATLMKMQRPAAFSSEKEADKWRLAMERAQDITSAIRLAESPRAKELSDQFKTAGLGSQGSYVGLADLRQQTQLAGFGPGGALGMDNDLKEFNLNLKALNNTLNNRLSNDTAPKSVNSNDVGPPSS